MINLLRGEIFSPLSFLMIDISEKNYLLEKYIRQAASTYNRVSFRSNGINFPCNVCGNGYTDSSKSKRSKRGWLKFLHGKWYYRCWNCSSSMMAENWLKQYHRELYNQFYKEVFQSELSERKFVIPQKQENKEEKQIDDKEEAKNFKPILSSDKKIFRDSINNCNQRNIPEHVWKKWYVCQKGFYKNRLIIPFYNKNNKIIYWHARALYNQEPKYLNCTFDKNKVIQSQIEMIDKSKEVILVEGYIDSLFINNSISTLGTNWSRENQEELDKLNCYYMLDYDTTKETAKKIQQLLKSGKWVFNWKKYLKDSGYLTNTKWDINLLYLHQKRNEPYTFSDFEKYFTNSWFDKFWFV